MAGDSKQAKQDVRKTQILRATLRLVRKHGCAITTAQIAAEAHCSKETLYNWFGDRDGIMLALVEEQAKGMKQVLDQGLGNATGTVEERLKVMCTLLLDMMTGEAVLAVNRVAMSQSCQDDVKLGKTLLADWDESVVACFKRLFHEGNETGELVVHSPQEAFENLAGLLVGDRQRRMLLGEDLRPNPDAMVGEATKAVQRWMLLYRR